MTTPSPGPPLLPDPPDNMKIDTDPILETTGTINAPLPKHNPTDQKTFATVLSQTVPCTSVANTPPQPFLSPPMQDMELLEPVDPNKSFQSISLSEEEKARIYKPWAFTLIVKLHDKWVKP
ncbi:hypothetical protein P3L10_003555 [Capsicum annuum]